ncbi:hypothetical protein [Winogradskyella endarachnes]|uniref:Uncharacterized protein n=1 Tax=Winogradskyella endarachnes TaxID=2681965 RepID=A0A6L6U880_9FLAO|nr:hypothetical protein [Winogradskyella endarachnes]MUU78219.1 hypothetical protein [Winogradskyella endarachnes]
MKTNVEMNKKVKDILDSAELIDVVNVSPFFKENVMHQIRAASADIQEVTRTWFTPKLQLATLICVIVLNVLAFSNTKSATYDENVSSFAESYGLSTSTESSLFN